MKQNFTQQLIQFGLIIFLLSFSLNGYTQKTFTVVCDKTDNTVKVVDADKRSPNYVPIKGGFPFRQVAQKWIDENYSTTQCDPGEITNQIKAQSQSVNSDINNNTVTAAPPQHTTAPGIKNVQSQTADTPIKFNNTSLLLDIKFSNLGEALLLENNLVPGIEIGMEQLFGNEIYFGTGVHFNAYLATLENSSDDDSQFYYFGRIPVFLGYRLNYSGMMIMAEAGAEINTKMASTETDKTILGRTGKDNSVNFLGRVKIGSETVMLELGTEFWLTEILENYEDFNMTAFYLGLRFYF
ncbi:hypothetical protein GM418_00315 [Maribellus comscasis]|uniref:Outer membrane protein beta-barrel domain-containing protein n=1 Tax=Maribellus comscasis TaxID=2681766 RepID=A0A6I6JMF8_9BACT|nr:hypothetical protein [Maribellus comscasis]QGY42150.1 hypothetical protein GM418_00315 [Maribellus comscasis]